jgi:NhaP-type Na+/H+ or K+/H+ antiporter
MDIETIWYEISPYVYTLGGVLALANSAERIGQVSGVLLLVAAITVIRLRWVNRRKN